MKKVCIIFLFLFIFSPIFAENEDDALYEKKIEEIPEITSVNYSGNLWKWTIISINWNYLNLCTSLKVNNESVKILDKSSSTITYSFDENNSLAWTVFLNCEKYNPNRGFWFPFIQSIEWFKTEYFDWNITIRWENFWDNWSVTIEGGTFNINTFTDRIIIWNISKEIKKWLVTVSSQWMLSNTYEIWLKVPKIKFLYSPKWFTKGSEIFIYGENLHSEFWTYIQYGDKKINKFKLIEGWLSFILWDDIWNTTISVSANNIISNKVEVNINQSAPTIKTFWKWMNGTNDSTITLNVENIPSNENSIEVYMNGGLVPFKSWIQNNNILIENVTLKYWLNYFQVWINGKKSNIVKIENNIDKPSITWITIWDLENDMRTINVWVHNYKSWITNIYLDGWMITPQECKGNSCKILLWWSQTKWKFTVGFWDYINPEWHSFDFSDEFAPRINSIKFFDTLKSYTKYEVTWSNFLKSNISGSNIFSTTNINDQEVPDFKIVSDTQITWRLPFDYLSWSTSSISINKLWLSTSITFWNNNIVWNKVASAPTISNFEASDRSFNFINNGVVNLYWRWFSSWDKLIINWKSYKLQVKNHKEASFVIPSDIPVWYTSFTIENIYWLNSESKSLKIVEKTTSSKIEIESKKIDDTTFFTNDVSSSKLLYKININNKNQWLFIEWLKFLIKWEKDSSILWTFALEVWWKKYITMVENWVLNFTDTFYIAPWYESEINLYKDSDFINIGQITVTLDKNSVQWKIETTKYTPANFNIWEINTNTYIIKEKEISGCVDTDSEKTNCNNFIKKMQSQDSIQTQKSEVNNALYTKIDTFLQNFYKSQEKKSAKAQMELYKVIEKKIEKLVLSEKNKVKLELFSHMHESLKKQYKIAFKKYILEK